MTAVKQGRKLCGAKTKRGTCARTAGAGTDHLGYGRCSTHFGKTQQVTVAANREQALEELGNYGQPVDIDPHEAILLCIRIVAGEIQYATVKVNELEEHELLVQPVEEHDRPLSEGKDGENTGITVTEVKRLRTELNGWIKIRHEGMDRLVRYTSTAMRAGLEERMVQIAEAQGRLMAEAVQGILLELGVADHPKAQSVVRKHLMQIAEKSTC